MMASNQDARPFTDLKKDAEEFRAKFDEDIRECMAYLDGKITDLICDPDSIGSQGKSFKQNALAEFSRAKYDIFISVKSLINTKEREWLNYISEMKKLFIENVEIFLAGTKLEIKLPASEFQPSTGSKKSPGNRRVNTSSVTSSIYPLLNTITKSIPVEEDFQFNRRGRLSASSVKLERSQEKCYQKESPDDSYSSDTSRNEIEMENEAMDVDNTEFVKSVGARSTRGRKTTKAMIEEDTNEPGPSKSPRKVAFSNDDDISHDLDIEIPTSHTKYAARRKTLLPKLEDLTGADIIPGKPTHSKYKRKTISNVHDLEDVAPPKRLKAGNRKNVSSQEEDNAPDDNFSESDVPFTNWIPLSSVDGRVPTRPAIYEVKVWRAKKPAYIGSCESLRQKLTLYKLRQNSNHKHLDKFIERNYDDIQVRYEITSSLDEAKRAQENRIKDFVEEHKTTPAYN